jgi:hypothetical protein
MKARVPVTVFVFVNVKDQKPETLDEASAEAATYVSMKLIDLPSEVSMEWEILSPGGKAVEIVR